MLWTQSLEMDAERVNKFSLPFALSDPPELTSFSGTDDAEQAALAAVVLLNALSARGGSPDPDVDALFDAWSAQVLPQQDHYWGSVADRSAIVNAGQGMRAPETGTDNPHFYDDSSVARSVPIGILYSGQPERASLVASRFASITNDAEGVDAAGIFAASIARLVDGEPMKDVVGISIASVEADSWLGRKLAAAEEILAEAGSVFAAIPRWVDEISGVSYNFGNVVAETLPLALLIARHARDLADGLGMANLIPKQADTMPAMVGALIGASAGASAIPETWRPRLDLLRGFAVPSTSGVRLTEIADQLLAARGTIGDP